jgi:hypothetical protein
MACRFRPVDRNASAVLHIEKHLFSRARGDKNSGRLPWPISTRVGNVRNNDSSLIEPVAAA